MVYFSGEVVLTAEEVLNEEGNPEVMIRCVALNWFHVHMGREDDSLKKKIHQHFLCFHHI